MKVLVESSRKGPMVVSRALLSIADYLDKIYKVSERLKDLLSEITSSMKSQVSLVLLHGCQDHFKYLSGRSTFTEDIEKLQTRGD